MAVTSLPVLHHQPEADLATVTSIVTGWRHGAVYSIILMVVFSPLCPCPPFLHHQLGDMAWQDAEARLVDLVLAGWRHGTKRGQGPRLFIVLLVYWHYLYTLSSISITNIYLLAILAFQLYYRFLVVSSPQSTIPSQEIWHCKR